VEEHILILQIPQRGKIDGQDLEERIGEIPPTVGSAKEARRLWSCLEFKF
jgi:hypothetical protein